MKPRLFGFRIFPAVIAAALPACGTLDVRMSDQEFAQVFVTWRQTVESELRLGRKEVHGDKRLLERIQSESHLHRAYIIEWLSADKYSVMTVEGNPFYLENVRPEIRSRLPEAVTLEERRKLWLKALGR